MYIPVIVLIAMIHFVIALLTIVDVDEAHKHHGYDGFQGWVLVVMKLVIYAYFVWCYIDTKPHIKKRSEKYF